MLLRTLERARRASTHGHRQCSVRLLNAKKCGVCVCTGEHRTVILCLLRYYTVYTVLHAVSHAGVYCIRGHTRDRGGVKTPSTRTALWHASCNKLYSKAAAESGPAY